jgi:hypothetical protein
MSKPALAALDAATPPGVPPSRALVSAALAGLLCAATPACNSTSVDDGTQPMTGGTGGAEGASGGASSAGGGASSPGGRATTGGTSSAGAGGNAATSTGGIGPGGRAESEAGTAPKTPDASTTSTGGADGGSVFPQPGDAGVDCHTDGGPPVITSSKIVPDLTLEQFTAECDAWHGVVQIPPHCGGFNTCRGMSYDSGTDVFTEHTCRGLSTCSGFSCVLCPP